MSKQISEKAAVSRVNRALAKDGLRIKTNRWGTAGYNRLGRHYIVNDSNVVDTPDIDVEAWGRELGVIAQTEAVQ